MIHQQTYKPMLFQVHSQFASAGALCAWGQKLIIINGGLWVLLSSVHKENHWWHLYVVNSRGRKLSLLLDSAQQRECSWKFSQPGLQATCSNMALDKSHDCWEQVSKREWWRYLRHQKVKQNNTCDWAEHTEGTTYVFFRFFPKSRRCNLAMKCLET